MRDDGTWKSVIENPTVGNIVLDFSCHYIEQPEGLSEEREKYRMDRDRNDRINVPLSQPRGDFHPFDLPALDELNQQYHS